MYKPLLNFLKIKFNKPLTITIATDGGKQTDPVPLSETCMHLTE